MYSKIIWFAIIVIAVLPADGKKTKKKKNNDGLESTPQPNVLTYSTFGFNDVGSYDGFLQNSPDFSTYNKNKEESQMRLYAPAFPSSIDATGLGSYYDPQQDNPILNSGPEGQNNVKSYQPVAVNFFTSPSFDSSNEKKNAGTKETVNFNNDNTNYPIYGTKISSKIRNRPSNDFNSTEYNILDSVSSVIEKNYNNDHTSSLASDNLQPSESQHYYKFPSPSSSVSFPKVIDFTSAKKYYPTSVESKYTNQKPIHLDMSQNSGSNENSYTEDNKNGKEHPQFKNIFNGKDGYDVNVKKIPQVNFVSNLDSSDIYPNINNNFNINKYRPENKDKVRNKQEYLTNNNDVTKTLKNPIKGYEYSTNHSTASFQIDYYGKSKQPFNSSMDEIIPESSNLNLVNYRFPDKHFSGLKTLPNIKPLKLTENDDTISFHSHDTYKPSEEYLEAFKDYYSGVPSTASHWGNVFKTTEFSSFKKHPVKPILNNEDNDEVLRTEFSSFKKHPVKSFLNDEENDEVLHTEFSSFKKHPVKSFLNDEDNDEIVHIPKRPHTYEKYSDTLDTSEWPFPNRHKTKKTKQPEWAKDYINNKFKTEEDLLGLRNQDSVSSSYLPTFNYKYNDLAKDFDYNKLSDRWRQSYLKSKNKDHDYETYSSETNAVHVPRPRPYHIEVPHPVIVPVPQPYPVKVPIPKLVTVPVIRELRVPVEKPMPYPVYKNVPYIVEKPVPVPVEKQVRVPVVKPYPVHVPQVRPLFHHKRPHDDREDDEEYEARPDTRRPVYKRPKNSRNRPRSTTRRPTRMVYRDSSKRRYPVRRPAYKQSRPRRPSHAIDQTPSRYHEDFEDDSDSDFIRYCKRTGKC